MIKVGAFVCLMLLSFSKCASIENSCESEHVCIAVYNPICASNGKAFKTFSNACKLEVFNKCNKMQLKLEYNGECKDSKNELEKCDPSCPLDYDPICGFNGYTHRTFTNKCYLERFNCYEDEAFVHRFNGTCWNPELDCKIACTKDRRPICAYDGVLHRTFANECELRVYNCPRNFFVMIKKFDGDCGPLYEGQKCNEKNCDAENSKN